MSTISSTDERLFKTLANADVVDVSRMDTVREVAGDGEEADSEYESEPPGFPHPPTAPSRFDSVVNEHMERRSKPPSAVPSVSSVRRGAPLPVSHGGLPPMPPMGGPSGDDMLAKQYALFELVECCCCATLAVELM